MQYTANFAHQKSPEYKFLKSVNRKIIQRFLWSLDHPKESQQKVFAHMIANIHNTDFAKEHNVSSRVSMEDFRRDIPIRSYDDLFPWLSQYHRTQNNSITKAKVLSFVETSGTTAQPKWIPVTKRWAATIKEAQALWTLSMIHDHPMVATGKALTMVSPAEHAKTQGGFVVGSNTGRMQKDQAWWIPKKYPIPNEVFAISSNEVKQYVYLRFALQEHITSWTTANPSMLLLLCRRLEEWKAFFTEDLRKGTLRCGPATELTFEQRSFFEAKLMATAPPFDWRPAKIWPLAVVNCWKGGSASFFLSRLRESLGGDVPIREVGITASEGYFALPLGSDWDGGVLWTQGHLLEFVDKQNTSFWSWELEVGKQYRLVITTETGLVRYDLKDVVEVVGFCSQTPVIRFVGKYGRFLNAVGEKLSEEQIARAMNEVITSTNSHIVGFTAHIKWGDIPYIEVGYEGRLPLEFQEELDRSLCRQNIEYEAKRTSQRLGPPQIIHFSEGTYNRYRNHRIQEGAPAGQIKDPILAISEEEWMRVLKVSKE